MSASLYFAAIIPPPDICDRVTAIKTDFRERFGSKHALRLVPHITLKAPFKTNTKTHDEIMSWFGSIDTGVTKFLQLLEGFDCFSNRRNPVVFIRPILNHSLKRLQQNVLRSFEISFPGVEIPANERRFHPHVTVGYRDLSYEMFKQAWQEYKDKEFQATFQVDNFCLLQHDKKQWNIVAWRELN